MTYHVQFLLLVLAGWVNRQQQDVIDYLREENRVLRAGLRGKRLRLSDDDRRRLADHVSQHIETLQRSLPTSLLLVPSLVRIGKRAKTQYRYSLSDPRQSSG